MKSVKEIISRALPLPGYTEKELGFLTERVVTKLREEGYAIVPAEAPKVDLPELSRMFGNHAVSAEEATYWFNRAFEMGREAA